MRSALAACVVVGGCGGDGGTFLAVDLRTDLVPAVEFHRIAVRFDGAVRAERVPGATEDFALGQPRVAELSDVAPGRHVVEVTLESRGTVVARRAVDIVVASETAAVLVVITRDCATVACPGAADGAERTECVGGRCVPRSCVTGAEPTCPTRQCVDRSECAARVAPCERFECVGGACIVAPSCVTPLAPDAGTDAGPDGDGGRPPLDGPSADTAPGSDASGLDGAGHDDDAMPPPDAPALDGGLLDALALDALADAVVRPDGAPLTDTGVDASFDGGSPGACTSMADRMAYARTDYRVGMNTNLDVSGVARACALMCAGSACKGDCIRDALSASAACETCVVMSTVCVVAACPFVCIVDSAQCNTCRCQSGCLDTLETCTGIPSTTCN